MRLTSLTLNRYRNLEPQTLKPGPLQNILAGSNAQGKTNLLEAIYVCCVGRSHQTVRDRELIRWGEETASVSLDCARRDGIHRIEVGLTLSGRKTIRINGSPIHRIGDLMGHINAVIFTPAELSLVRDGPSCRRRFLNMSLSQIRPDYFLWLQRYHQALSQRNALLRAPEGGVLATLPVWDAQLARAGARLTADRRDFCARLAVHASEIHAELAGGESFTVSYSAAAEADDTERLEAALLALLINNRENDVRRGITTAGPHRDDIVLRIDGADARVYGSQGQKRTCALSMKLAEREIMREETGEEPLLLLDDVFSELDGERRRMLLGFIGGTQTFITCVSAEQEGLPRQEDALVCDVIAGRIRPRGRYRAEPGERETGSDDIFTDEPEPSDAPRQT
ncbi:MAG: DNA replication/repair protein RecF [Clostridiales bacterium]|nr:DNA replication/repair protein RecF [Clostridiales bacterium]